MRRRLLSLLLVLVMVVGMCVSLPPSAGAVDVSSFISNATNKAYINKMIGYYLDNYSELMTTLKAGNPVVMFFEGGSDNVTNSSYSALRYRVDGVCIVLKYNFSTSSVYVAYSCENCSSIPDHPLAYGAYNHGQGSSYGTATLKDGIYNLYTVNHPHSEGSYAGFQVYKNSSSSVPAVYMKSGGYSELNASGINLHTRRYQYVSGESNPWSAGCILIGASTSLSEYNKFIETTAPSDRTRVTTEYKGAATTKYSPKVTVACGKLVMDRYLHRSEMMQIYENQNAVDCITAFSVAAYKDAANLPSEPAGCSHSYYVDYQAMHPHKETMICSKCGDFYYTGNVRCTTGVEAAHPHKYYYVCEVTSCDKHMTYTGEVATVIRNENTYPYKEYIACFENCSYDRTYTGNDQIPGKPALKNMKREYKSGAVSFSWDGVKNATHYNIYLDCMQNGTYERIFTQHYAESGVSCTLEPGTYRVLIQATNANYMNGDGSSWLYTDGNWVAFSVYGNPDAPTGVTATTVGSKVTVSWNASEHAEKYDVYLVQAPWGWNDIKYSMSTTGTSTTFSDVANGMYCAFVIARPNADKVQSEWIPVTVEAKIPGVPVVETSASYIRENSTITLSWDAVDGAEFYRYYLTEYPEDYVYSENTENGYLYNETSVTFESLPNGRYGFFVRACNSEGYSPSSEWVYFDVYKDDYLPVKTTTYNGHIYALYDDEMSWSFARDLCSNMGGHLVTITSKEESEFVTSLIQEGIKDAYWLGASNYGETGGKYAWVTGEEFVFENWKDGEPNGSESSESSEHFAEIRKSYSNNWNDVSNTNKTNKGFIVEIEPSESDIKKSVRYHGSEYLLIDRTATWMDAKLYCEMLGGHLVTINTAEEDTVVNALIDQGSRSWYYVGATQKDGSWYWLDGTLFEDIDWSDKATDWYQRYQLLMKYRSDKTYLPFRNCYYPATNLNYTGFVCEIELPTPDLTLSTINGAQIRTTGAQGLRFISSIDKTADFDRVVEYGTVLIPSADITDISELVIDATLNGHKVAKVKAKYIYDEDDDAVTFTAVITNVAAKNYAREYTARAYAILDDGTVVYADSGASRSIYAVAKRGLENPNESDANKALFQSIVDTVEGGNEI